jgi:ABC-2 type transport system ATP-binding protein
MIKVNNLTVAYKNKKVLDDVNVVIEKEERCALIGRNGAGKSTFIYSLLNLLPVKQGQILINGIDHKQNHWKKHVAYLPEKFQLYPHLTGEENLRFFASLNTPQVDDKKIEEILNLVSLWGERNVKSKQYSKGMLQRLGLGIMLYYDAEIFVFDEPTSGLDPMGREDILSILHSLRGKTILLSSHHFDEVKKICTRIAHLENGKITKYSISEFESMFMAERG